MKFRVRSLKTPKNSTVCLRLLRDQIDKKCYKHIGLTIILLNIGSKLEVDISITNNLHHAVYFLAREFTKSSANNLQIFI